MKIRNLAFTICAVVSQNAFADSILRDSASHEICGSSLHVLQLPYLDPTTKVADGVSSLWYITGSQATQDGGISISHTFPIYADSSTWSHHRDTNTWHAQISLTGATGDKSHDEMWVTCAKPAESCKYEFFNFDSGAQRQVDISCRPQSSPQLVAQSYSVKFSGTMNGSTELVTTSFLGSKPVTAMPWMQVEPGENDLNQFLEFDKIDVMPLGGFFAGDLSVWLRYQRTEPYVDGVKTLGRFRLAASHVQQKYVGNLFDLTTGKDFVKVEISKTAR